MNIWNNIEVYVINLDRSPDRLKNITRRLKILNIPFTRFSAVDGKNRIFNSSEVNSFRYFLSHGKTVTPTEVACFISHVNVMKKFVNESVKPFALILEDDMILNYDFVDVLSCLIDKKNWDLVKLNGAHRGGNLDICVLNDNYNLVKNYFHQSKTGAYVLNRYAAKQYIKQLLPMFVPIDHEFIKFWKYKIRGFSVSPFPSWEEDGQSTIDYKQIKKNRKMFLLRIPSMFYKIYIAIRRIIWCVFSL